VYRVYILNHIEFIGSHISTLVINTFMFQLVASPECKFTCYGVVYE